MQTPKKLFYFLGLALVANETMHAHDHLRFNTDYCARPILGFTGGVAVAHPGCAQTSPVIDQNRYTYKPNCCRQIRGLVGGYAGVNIPFHYGYDWAAQLCAAYEYILPFCVRGRNTAGTDDQSATPYDYSYKLLAQHLLFDSKVLFGGQHFKGYGSFVFGPAFNKAGCFKAVTTQQHPTLTPTFKNHCEVSAAVGAGIGFEFDFCTHWALDIGYQFLQAGKANLGKGKIVSKVGSFDIPFALKQHHLRLHEFLVQLTYIF